MRVLDHRSVRRVLRAIPLCMVAVVFMAAVLGVITGCGSSSSSDPSPSASASSGSSPAADIKVDPALKSLLPSSIQDRGAIAVASDIPYPPWEYFDPPDSQNVAGFDYDISQALGAKIGIPVTWSDVSWDSILVDIKAGKHDMIMSEIGDNAERQKSGISFVDYAYDPDAMLVLKGNPNGIDSLASLSGKTVACERGAAQQGRLEALNTYFKNNGMQQIKLIAVPDQPAALLALKGGRAAAVLTNTSTASNVAQTTNDGNTFEVVSEVVGEPGYTPPAVVGIAIPASNPELIVVIQKALQGLMDDGTYQEILAKWGIVGTTSSQVNQGEKPNPSISPLPAPSPSS